MPRKEKIKSAQPRKAKGGAAGQSAASQSATARPTKVKVPKATKGAKTRTAGTRINGTRTAAAGGQSAQVLASKTVYQGPLFRVVHDKLIEPGGKRSERDVIRHNGSVVILAVDDSKSKKDPWIVIERQYRHPAQQILWELPAGTLEPGEDPLAGARRELAEETGYSARKWQPLFEYYASPGFLGESMKIFLAEGLVAGEARPEDDEEIEFRLVKLSDLLSMIEKGAILDGKTLTSALFYARQIATRKSKAQR